MIFWDCWRFREPGYEKKIVVYTIQVDAVTALVKALETQLLEYFSGYLR